MNQYPKKFTAMTKIAYMKTNTFTTGIVTLLLASSLVKKYHQDVEIYGSE
jgi:hypothetical protein